MPSEDQSPLVVSRRKLFAACALFFLAAIILAITVVLPAEFGIDPLGTGRALGLLAIDQPTFDEVSLSTDNSDQAEQDGAITHMTGTYRVDSRELVVLPYDFVEYKYHLVQGATMLYAWEATGPVNHDFHGEPDDYPQVPAESFDSSVRREASGSFTAPFSGIHGWFWENPGPTPVRVQIDSAGFYSFSVEVKSNRERTRHEVSPVSDQSIAERETP